MIPVPPGVILLGIHPADKPAPEAPAGRRDEAAELLGVFLIALLELPGWIELSAALPNEMFDRIDRR